MKLERPPATKESVQVVWSLLLWNVNSTVGCINWRSFHNFLFGISLTSPYLVMSLLLCWLLWLILCKWKSQTGYFLCIGFVGRLVYIEDSAGNYFKIIASNNYSVWSYYVFCFLSVLPADIANAALIILCVCLGTNVDHLVVILTVTGIRIAIVIVPKEIVMLIADEHTVIAEKRSQNGFQVSVLKLLC